MLRLLFLRFWPIWLPLVLYVLWMGWLMRRARKKGEEPPRLKDGPWLWAVMATLGVAVLMFLWLGLTRNPEDGTYIPAQNVDGTLIPGRIE